MANGQGFSSRVGSGTVQPSTFVSFMTGTASTGDVVAGYRVQQTVATGTPIIGISQEGTRYAPTDEQINASAGGATGAAGYTGDQIKVYALGDICMLSIGSTVTPQQLLMTNASGQGVPATGSANIGAQAIEGGTSGDLIRVMVVLGVL